MTPEELKRAEEIAATIKRRPLSHTSVGNFSSDEELKTLAQVVLSLSEALREARDVITCNWNYCSDSKPCEQCRWLSKYGEKK